MGWPRKSAYEKFMRWQSTDHSPFIFWIEPGYIRGYFCLDCPGKFIDNTYYFLFFNLSCWIQVCETSGCEGSWQARRSQGQEEPEGKPGCGEGQRREGDDQERAQECPNHRAATDIPLASSDNTAMAARTASTKPITRPAAGRY